MQKCYKKSTNESTNLHIQDEFEFKIKQTKDIKQRKTKKTNFCKKEVENVDFYKSVMNKIMTKHK